MKKLKYISQNAQKRRSVEIENRLFEMYKNSLIPHGRNIKETEYEMVMGKCVPIHHISMHLHTGNVCYVVVIIDHMLILQDSN